MQTENQQPHRVGRTVSLKHRTKKTAKGEARPTLVGLALTQTADTGTIELEDSLAELDYVHGKFPVSWRTVVIGENLSEVQPHHIRFRKPSENESLESALAVWPRESLQIEAKGRGTKRTETLTGIPTEVPKDFTGLQPNDTIVSMFGGSGSSLMIAVLNKAHEIGAQVLLVSPHNVKAFRDSEHREKGDDHTLLLELWHKSPELFHEIHPSDVQTWEVMARWDFVEEAMRQRLRLIQRATKRAEHEVFARNEYLGSKLAQEILTAKMANNTVADVLAEEKECQQALEEAIENDPLYQGLFGDVRGCGPRFYGKVLSAVRDIRRFPRSAPGAFLLYSGFAIVKHNGKPTIQRFRLGVENNNPGTPEIKQAVWLLVSMQFVYQKDSPWGVRLREIRDEMTAKRPNALLICDSEIPLGKGKYTYDEAKRECLVNFGRGREQLFIGDIVGKTDAKVLKVESETITLPNGENQWSVSNRLHTVKLDDGRTIYRIGTNKWTKAHIWKNAQWRAGTEFLLWLHKRWWQYVDEQEALRNKEKEVAKAA